MQLYLHPEDPECMYLVINLAARMNQDYSEERMRNLVKSKLSSIPRLIQTYHVHEGVSGPANDSINGNKPCTLVNGQVMNAICLGEVNTARRKGGNFRFKGIVHQLIPKGLGGSNFQKSLFIYLFPQGK